jgi:uncharacterized protein YndB with AHSA1/START domain
MEATYRSTISIEKTFTAPIEKLWKAWTDPALVLNWFGSDPNGSVSKAELDVRPGGRFEITFNNADQTEHTCWGNYQELHEFRKLTFSWMWKSEPGIESFVTVLLAPEGLSTRMQFIHANVWNASTHGYLKGWNGAFAKLERMLTASQLT